MRELKKEPCAERVAACTYDPPAIRRLRLQTKAEAELAPGRYIDGFDRCPKSNGNHKRKRCQPIELTA